MSLEFSSSSGTIRYDTWKARLALRDSLDTITVRNLELTVHAGRDVWGRSKEQRALVTVSLSLAKLFDSAAVADALDPSTVHYGILSKDIRNWAQSRDSGWTDTQHLAAAIATVSATTAAGTALSGIEIDIFYPKASMLGDGAGWLHASVPGHSSATVLYLRNLRIPCLIGVNSNERTRKQPVVVNLWLDRCPLARCDDYVELEQCVTQTISETSFETLEALSIEVIKDLRKRFFRQGDKDDDSASIRLRIEKPMAVPFADAPAIEILRPVKV